MSQSLYCPKCVKKKLSILFEARDIEIATQNSQHNFSITDLENNAFIIRCKCEFNHEFKLTIVKLSNDINILIR